ncbi:conserved protein of unknown function [Tenacibaculum sp. 190524A02b]|uniref:hypothetical protein n=1 Tax=Tenacibaculum vairaonense TaxID=3137860 RepID=UPI0032B256D6
MNKIKTLSFFILLLVTIQIFGQSFNYQGVLRDANGQVLKNKFVGIQFRILQGSATGSNVFQETHSVTTNEYGVINISVGTGTVLSGNFSVINWSTQNHWLEVAVDISGGTTYTVLGSSKLQGVPYASYAETSGDKVFSTTNNITSNANGSIATDDFVFGSMQLASNNSTNDDDRRFFFDKSKGAFRAGTSNDSSWDEANLGIGSAAFGYQNIVTDGFNGFAAGSSLTVRASNGVAFGDQNLVTGNYAFAHGEHLTSETRSQITLGHNNTPDSGSQANSNTLRYPEDRLFVIGNGTFDNKSDALVIRKNGNTAINGQLTIDGDNQGAGTSYTLPAQDGSASQIMTTDGAGNVSWTDVGSNGAFSTTTNVTSNNSGNIGADDFVFGSNQLANNGTTNDDDNRMFFDKSKAAFRVGVTPDDLEEGETANQWNDTNVGFASFAAGVGSIASGDESIALGRYHTASGDNSVTIGSSNKATALGTIAIGGSNVASGVASIAIGDNVSTSSRSQITLGINNVPIAASNHMFISTDPLLVIGNGTLSTPSNALVMLKNGNTTLKGSLTIDGDNQGSGASYTLPIQDGAANQVMITDGSGNASWTNIPAPVVEAYTAVTLNTGGGWENYNTAFSITSFQDPRYRLNDNVVYLEGMVRKNVAINNADVIMTLPVGFRPQKTRVFSVQTENGSIRVDVNPSGTVVVASGFNVSQNWVSLDGITFSID